MSAVQAHITDSDSGGFRAVASTPDVDRDGEIIDAGAFNPLPASIPCHSDHVASVGNLVARAVPSYVNGRLMIDATFASTPDAQAVRQKVLDGVLDTVSVAFFNADRKSVDGVTHVRSAELLSVDLVTIPSNRGARVLSHRSFAAGRSHPEVEAARRAMADALITAARADLTEARAIVKATDPRGPRRREVDQILARSLSSTPRSASDIVRHFLRSL